MDASDFLTADFQRVNISGEDSSGVPVEDLHSAAELLTRALNIREKYMRVSHQEFPANVERYNIYIYTSSQYLFIQTFNIYTFRLPIFFPPFRFLGMMKGKPVTEPDTIISKATIAGI